MMSNRPGYSDFELRFSELSNALGHAHRIAIIFAIIKNNNLIEKQNISIENLSGIVVNKHLAELKKAGLIVGKIKGLNCSYSVDKGVIYEYLQMAMKFKVSLMTGGN